MHVAQQDTPDVMTTTVTPLAADAAQRLVQDRFGIEAVSATPLDSEKDQNFHVQARDGRAFVLKITNPAEDRAVTNLQTEAMLHAASSDAGVVVPEVFADVDGVREPVLTLGGNPPQVVRLLSYLPGIPLHLTTPGPAQRRALGEALGRLGLALRGFTHRAADHEMAWDLAHAARVRRHLVHVPDTERRALAERVLDAFEARVVPLRSSLRAQVVHGDFNPFNVLVLADDHDRIAGVIDFGDCVRTNLVNDLAIACAYHLEGEPRPFDFAAEIVGAYHAVTPLEPAELDVLPDLIGARLVMGVAINGWRAALQPENAAYILANNDRAWSGIERLVAVSPDDARHTFARAVGLE